MPPKHLSGTRHRRIPSGSPPWWFYLAASAFLLYFSVLVYADSFRREHVGVLVRFDSGGAVLTEVVAGSPAAASGLRPGDRVMRYMDRAVQTRLDWTAVDANTARQPVTLDVRRDDMELRVALPARRTRVWQAPELDSAILAVARTVQLVCLVVAAILAFRRPHDRLARLGAWLLGSLGVFTVVLPFGFAEYWRNLPGPLHALMWPPFLSGVALPVLFFAFCAEFPRPAVRHRWPILAMCAPGVAATMWHMRYGYLLVYREAPTPLGRDWSGAIVVLGILYLVGGLLLLRTQLHQTSDTNERRRLHVLLASTAIACVAGGGVAGQFWLRATPRLTHSLFDSPVTLVGMPVLLVFPAAIGYTILRHRLFDFRVIVRQGIRYALARRLLLSLVPMVLLLLAADLFAHRQAPLADTLRLRIWPYLGLAAVLVVALAKRTRWRESLDRRFFRERYRAEEILRDVAVQLRDAPQPAGAIAAVVHQVTRALQPSFVAALGTAAADSEYQVLCATPAFPATFRPDRDSRLIALARVIRSTLELSPDRDTWIGRHLPAGEAEAVFDAQVELLIPVSLGTDREVVLVLGPKQSEEPYSADDRDLLEAIASNLGLVLDRAGATAWSEVDARLAECPVCSTCFDTSIARCPRDSAILMVRDLTPLLAGRYRLLRRIGAGGMGCVYSARDEALQRTVAVKVLGDHLTGNTEAIQRFEREARAAASFTHPNVVTIHDFGMTPNARAFFVMEQLEGRTLREELVASGRLEPIRALRVVRDICDVLEGAHARGLVHRDLKPENVYLARTAAGETTKVLDFGIAKVLPATGSLERTNTQTGVLLGTLAYMSPEQLRGVPVDLLCDLWAIGVIAYEVLTGERPPAASRTSGGTAIDVSLPSATVEFFNLALAEQRDKRPQTARAFHAALAAALQPS